MRDSIRNLAMTAPPAAEPVTLAQAKVQCRVDASDTTEDAFITALIVAGRQLCEKENRRSYVARSYELRLDRFPPTFAMAYLPAYSDERSPGGTYGLIRPPKPPLISVESITYLDNTGAAQVLDPSLYDVDAGGVLQGSITPAFGKTWPQSRYLIDAVRVAYTAGYGDASTVPATAVQAILLLVAHLFRNREAAGDALVELPFAVKALLSCTSWGSYG